MLFITFLLILLYKINKADLTEYIERFQLLIEDSPQMVE